MPKQVLIIDDDEDTRIIYSLILQQAGYVVSQAGDGEAGLYAALDSKPALVVLDIGLPKCRGGKSAIGSDRMRGHQPPRSWS